MSDSRPLGPPNSEGMLPVTSEQFVRARRRLLKMHRESDVGHLGGALSCLDALLIIFHEVLRPSDEFILSKGHAVSALYTTLWSLGELHDEDLKTFVQDDTLLAGHPPIGALEHIRFATGSLGHGFSIAAGTALACRLMNQDARVYCMTSDGEWQEGSTWEALIFSCHHQLANLTVLVDENHLQAFGLTSEVASMDPLAHRLSGFDADVTVVDGHDPDEIRTALAATQDRFRIIVLQTVKGARVSAIANQLESHYLPLTDEQYRTAIEEVGEP